MGGTGASFLLGQQGADIIYASTGSSEFYSGGFDLDVDTLDFSKLTSAVNADLANSTFSSAGVGGAQIFYFDAMVGTAKDDVLRGNSNSATNINGKAGNDTIEGGNKADTLTGGGGIDTLSYEHSVVAVDVMLVAGKQAIVSGGDAGGDIATGFVNVIGSANGDTLGGDTGANVLEGLGGADTFTAAKEDTVSYAHAGAAVWIDLGKATQSSTAGFDNLGGGDNSDASGDVFNGSFGNVLGSGFDDHFRSNALANKIDGGAGFDTVDYQFDSTGVTVTLGKDGAASVAVKGGSLAAGDILINIEGVTGGTGKDTLTGNNVFHILDGVDGDDTLYAGTGKAFLYGGNNNDTLYANIGNGSVYSGDGGTDTLNFSKITTTGINFSLDASTGTGTGFSFAASGFEIVVGTGKDDTFTAAANTATSLDGGVGNDTLIGGTKGDTLKGGAGMDKFGFKDANTEADHIVDFAAGDKIQIDRAGFGNGLENLSAGSLSDLTFFVSGPNAIANNGAHGQFVYDTATHDLIWDANGQTAGGTTIIAHFDNNYVMKIADFLLV